MASPLDGILDHDALLELAGGTYFGRGEEYFREGRVRSLVEHGGAVAAKVVGTEEYRVKLWAEDGDLGHSCDCPLGMDEEFCKHCVAVGLAWLEGGASAPEATMDDVKTYLEDREKDVLVGLIMEQAMEDERLRERLLLRAARMGGLNLATYRKAIDAAVDFDDFPEYGSPWDYARGIENVVASIAELLEEGHAADEIVELSEYALAVVEGAMNYDADGSIVSALNDLEGIHHEACKQAKPDPETLARRLFEWELSGDHDTFFDAVDNYADVLGEEGIAAYRRLAEEEWADVPALAPDPVSSPSYYGRRARLTRIMETLARNSGGIEDLVAIKSKDLSNPLSYLRIAEIYKEAGDADKALEWAEEGLWVFPDEKRSELRAFVAERYHERGRHEEAMELAWTEFADAARFEGYQRLKAHADRGGVWESWREKALSSVREDIARRKKESLSSYFPRSVDHSMLARILLWEGEVEAAWREAKEGGCSDELWLELAARREGNCPEDSLAIYRERIEPLVQQTNNAAYEEAYKLLLKARGIMHRLDREPEFDEYVELLRLEYKRKRNFIKLLDGME